MRIYYFGELIEDTKKPKQTSPEQTKMNLGCSQNDKTGMQSIGDILQELDLTTDSFRSNVLSRRHLV